MTWLYLYRAILVVASMWALGVSGWMLIDFCRRERQRRKHED